MGWNVLSPGRWEFDGDLERHLLLQVGDRLVEFHDATVHVYEGRVGDERTPLGGPDLPAPAWVLTDVRPDLAGATDAEVWQALAEPRYTTDPKPPEDDVTAVPMPTRAPHRLPPQGG